MPAFAVSNHGPRPAKMLRVIPEPPPEHAPGTAELHPAWRRVLLARHAKRPHSLDYIGRLIAGFEEIHGDRSFADDPAIVAGFGTFDGRPVVVVADEATNLLEASVLCLVASNSTKRCRKNRIVANTVLIQTPPPFGFILCSRNVLIAPPVFLLVELDSIPRRVPKSYIKTTFLKHFRKLHMPVKKTLLYR